MERFIKISITQKDGRIFVERDIEGLSSLELVGLLHTTINEVEKQLLQEGLKTKKDK